MRPMWQRSLQVQRMSKIRFSIAVALLVSAAAAASAQATLDPVARAKSIGGSTRLGSGSPVFSQGGIDTNIPIYEGTKTPETSINAGNIKDRTRGALTGGTTASSAYQRMMDSAELRQKFDLETDYIGITNGDTATKEAENIAGQYFKSDTTENPACDFSDFSVLEPFTRFCDVHSKIKEVACKINRVVTVDRTDTWQCDIAKEDKTIRCKTNWKGECKESDLPDFNNDKECVLEEERCLKWQETYVREPKTGTLFEFRKNAWVMEGWFASDPRWILYWNGERLATHFGEFPPETEVDGWKYVAGDRIEYRFNLRWVDIFRHKNLEVRHPPAGALAGNVDGALFGWKGTGTQRGQLMWDGKSLGTHAPSAKIGECTYFRLDTQSNAGWSGVYRICPAKKQCLEFERDYNCTTLNQCGKLKSAKSCTQIVKQCLAGRLQDCDHERYQYACQNDITNYAPAKLIKSTINRIEDKLVNTCNPEPTAQGCEAGALKCTKGKAVKNILGFPVSRDCWQYEQTYSCVDGSAGNYSDCRPFERDSSCKVVQRTCLSFENPAAGNASNCKHWEYEYRCGGGIELPESCTATNVCIGDLCEGLVDEPNTDFANAAAWLTALDEAAKDSSKNLNSQKVELFSGTARSCKVGALGTINCCKDSGWANGVLGDCTADELALMDRVQAKAAVYVGTYCSKKKLWAFAFKSAAPIAHLIANLVWYFRKKLDAYQIKVGARHAIQFAADFLLKRSEILTGTRSIYLKHLLT